MSVLLLIITSYTIFHTIILVPLHTAAPITRTLFSVGGTLSYELGGVIITIPLVPVSITVYPSPRFYVDYFLQRDVFSDDPFTPEIEPAGI